MQTSNDYQEQAIRCLRLAQAMEYEPTKALLLDLAQQWLGMAKVARQREAQAQPSVWPQQQHPEHMTSQ